MKLLSEPRPREGVKKSKTQATGTLCNAHGVAIQGSVFLPVFRTLGRNWLCVFNHLGVNFWANVRNSTSNRTCSIKSVRGVCISGVRGKRPFFSQLPSERTTSGCFHSLKKTAC